MKRLLWTVGSLSAVILVSCGDDENLQPFDPCTENDSIEFVTNGTLPAATVNEDYFQNIAIQNGSGEDVRWTLASGDAIPSGLFLTQRGNPAVLSGRPRTAQTAEFTVRVSDSCGNAPLERTFTLEIQEDMAPLVVTTESLPDGSTETQYSARVEATGGTGEGYIFFPEAIEFLPPGINLAEDGTLSGQPVLDGEYTFTVNVADSVGNVADRVLSIAVGTEIPEFRIETLECPRGKALESFRCEICLSGGRMPYTCEFSQNSEEPPGINLFQPGDASVMAPMNCTVLSGVPTTADDPAFRINCADGSDPAERASESFFLTVDPPDDPLRITGRVRVLEQVSTNPPDFDETEDELFQFPVLELNREYHFGIVAVGGSEEGYQWSVVDGGIPAGMVLLGGTTTATLTGTPSELGTFNPTLRVEDSDGEFDTIARLAITVGPEILPVEITTTDIPDGVVGQTYTATISASQGLQPSASAPEQRYGWSVVPDADRLPPGLSIENLGAVGSTSTQITGTPTSTGTFTFEVKVNDIENRTDVQSFTVEVIRLP